MRAGEFQRRAWERRRARELGLMDSGREPDGVSGSFRALASASTDVSQAVAGNGEPASRPDALAPVRLVRPGRVIA